MSKVTCVKVVLLSALLLAASAVFAQTANVDLKGGNEVPANDSAATAKAGIVVAADKTVSGSITTTGIEGTMAHIHSAAVGANGPVVVALKKTGDNVWAVPDGAKLTDEQYAAYLAGNLYVNVHSSAHPGGELRGQLQPK